ncbi:MAG: T9SS type A sorting domain-containing protein [Flavobacteriales bacterium]
MRKAFLLSYFLIVCALKAQVVSNVYVDINNISAAVNSTGELFNLFGYSAGFEFPKNSGNHTIYSAGFIIGGQDVNNGSVKVQKIVYSDNNFQNGPITDPSLYVSEVPQWELIWTVSRAEINNHIQNFNNVGYIIPWMINNWPAHGDTTKGQNFYLAPFTDVDNNGLYEPANGDYPLIKGDFAAYIIQNDETDSNIMSHNSIGIELHTMVYAFDCINEAVLNNTVFVEYKVFNRRFVALENTYLGVFADLDIGCPDNDYIGADVEHGFVYAYNGTNNDNAGCGFAMPTYGQDLPVQGIVFLNGAKLDNDGIDNPLTTNIADAILFNGIPYNALGKGFGDGIIDNEHIGLYSSKYLPNIFPSTPLQYYLSLQNIHPNFTTMMYGNTTHECMYMFPGDSDPLYWGTFGVNPGFDWWESTYNNTSGDRRIMASSGPFTFTPNDTQQLNLAFTVAKSENGNLAALPVLKNYASQLHNMYNSGYICPQPSNIFENKTVIEFSVFPNPSDDQFTITTDIDEAVVFDLFDVSGRLVESKRFYKIIEYNTNNLDSGIYIVRLIHKSSVGTKSIIINR